MWAVVNSKSSSWNLVERLVFPAPKSSYNIKSFPEELILIPRADGEKIPCLFLPFKHARFLFIYFHANAEDLGLCYTFCTIIRDLFQVHVLAVEYPGYGICPGHCTEEGMMANATAAVRFAMDTLRWPLDGIKLFGRSIGTGPAVAMAAQYEFAGLILVTPFLSIQRIFRAQVGAFANLIADRFDNLELASKIESPTLIIHGQQDTLIPLAHSKLIYDTLPAKKMMVCPAMMGHNTSLLANVATFVLPMTQFFSLPDYTFEDIEVPRWVFPDLKAESAKKVEQDDNSWVCSTTPSWLGASGSETPRRVISELRHGVGGCLGGNSSASVGFPLPQPPGVNGGRAPPSAARGEGYSPSQSSSAWPSVGLPTPNPAMSGDIDAIANGTKQSFNASRNYDFRTPPTTPRGETFRPGPRMLPVEPTMGIRGSPRMATQPPTLQGDPEVVGEDCGMVPGSPSSPASPPDVISKDMQRAIDSGIAWLVDRKTVECEFPNVGNDETCKPDGHGPGTLRGAPALRERVVERLREASPDPLDSRDRVGPFDKRNIVPLDGFVEESVETLPQVVAEHQAASGVVLSEFPRSDTEEDKVPPRDDSTMEGQLPEQMDVGVMSQSTKENTKESC